VERDFTGKPERDEEAAMPTKKLWLCLGLLAIVIASVWSLVVDSSRVAAQQREALASFSRSVVLGMPLNEADRRCKQACVDNSGWTYERIHQWLGTSVAYVESPLTFGARNWVVYFVFEDDVVVAVLVRTADTPHLKPKGSPQDRVRDARASWLARFAPG
jgi:hypothetical protein